MGYLASVPVAQAWIDSNNLTYPVLADQHGDVTLTYTNWFGSPVIPWTSIVSTDWVLCYTDDAYAGGVWHLEDLVAVLDSLFAPEIGSDPGSLDFGMVAIDTTAELDIVLYNSGTGLLEITDITSTSPAFSPSATQGEIYAVDDSLVITVTFAPWNEITYDDTLRIISPDDTLEIYLQGEGIPAGIISEANLPRDFLISCYPNPFNAELTIKVRLEIPQEVSVTLFNIQGSREGELWRGELGGGTHELRWSDPTAPSGLYILKVAGAGWNWVSKVVLIR